MRLCLLVGLLGLAACSSELRWYTNCAPDCAGGLPATPDGGWGPGTCTTQQVGQECSDAGETCSTTADPCQPVLFCSETNPQAASTCQGTYALSSGP